MLYITSKARPKRTDSNNTVRVRGAVSDLRKSEDGATAIEYALLAALLALTIVSALIATGESLNAPFQDAAAALEAEGAEDEE